MNHFCPTIVIRHRKERLKKCSLRGLENRKEISFYRYPFKNSLFFEGYVLLTPNASKILSKEDQKGLLLIDATWKLAEKIEQTTYASEKRALPPDIVTAYPRRQQQRHGLASVEALYVAYLILGWDPNGLLDHYHWTKQFLEKNQVIR